MQIFFLVCLHQTCLCEVYEILSSGGSQEMVRMFLIQMKADVKDKGWESKNI